MTELLAIAQHTTRLPWLAARENYAEEYRLIARHLIRDIQAGYLAATAGHGTLADLMPDSPNRDRAS
ncbi:hypothetical protein [Streptomyces luteireticuli]|uniref:hypothetical protein n=1 Tax=Streptomyces luteireticuli TaxID=173858 RepID=UPI003555CAB0